MKNIDETKNYFLKEINQNELLSKKHKKVCKPLNSIEHLLIVISTIVLLSKIILLAKSKLNVTEVLIAKVLIDSNISHDEFVLINDVLKEFYDMNKEIKNSNDK